MEDPDEGGRMVTIEQNPVVPMDFDRLAEALVSGVGCTADSELLLMKRALGAEANEKDFQAIQEQIRLCLKEVKRLLRGGQIRPWQRVRLDPHETLPEQQSPGERPLRLGFLPTAANPLHWMHLLSGLSAIWHFHLDKVIYILAGNDPRKRDLPAAVVRHRMGREVLRAFSPFLEYSPISLESSLPGEVNVFRLLQLNAGQRIQAFYLAGTDHCRRFNPETTEPDTIQRLEDGVRTKLYGFDERRHHLSVIFLDRGDPVPPVDTFLDVLRIDRLPLGMSSTRIRDAIGGRSSPRVLAGIPFTVFSTIRTLGLYGGARPPIGERAQVAVAPRRVEGAGTVEQPMAAYGHRTLTVPSAGYSHAVPSISFGVKPAGLSEQEGMESEANLPFEAEPTDRSTESLVGCNARNA